MSLTPKQDAIKNQIGGGKVWTTRSTENENQIKLGDTLEVLHDASGNFTEIEHIGNSISRKLTPIGGVQCSFFEQTFKLGYTYTDATTGQNWDISIKFYLNTNPATFRYTISDSDIGGGGSGERGGGD